MRNKTVLIIIAIVVLIGGSIAYLAATSKQNNTEPITNSQTTEEVPANEETTPPPAQQTAPGAYVDYTSDIIAQTPGTKLLFFHAPWCSQCRSIEADIKKDGVPSGVTIIKIDYDSNQKLRQQYGVTLQTTFVKVDDAGKALQKYVAYDDPHLSAVVKNLL